MKNSACLAIPKDKDCEGPLALPNHPCCDTCAVRYQELVDSGEMADFMNPGGLPGEVTIPIGILEKASN